MRNIDSTLEERLNSSMQTFGTNANPAVQMRIQRHDVPLHDEELIERSRIVHRAGLTDSDVAVCHPYFEREDGRIWVAYVREGILHVKWAENMEILSRSEWNDYWFTADAVSCSIAFNSVPKHNPRGIWEFITEEEPWVFWVTPEGQLKAKLCTPLGQYEHELAIANVTDCSAVRAPAGDYGNWDLGLTVFFLMAGQLYYRQYIDGEWCDAERVTFTGLDELTIVKIKAFNTWDYRVGVQILTDDGKLYELFTYTEGIGVRGSEHISLNLEIEGRLKKIGYDTGYETEHLDLDISCESEMIYGLSSVPVSWGNINDGQGNYGLYVDVDFDYPNTGGGLPDEFTLTDSMGNNFRCEELEIIDETKLRLKFYDFNQAVGNLTLTYTQGTLHSIVPLTDSFTVTFTPTNLNPLIGFPSVDEIYNM